MKKLYYFTTKNLRFIEVSRVKFQLFLLASVGLLGLFVLGMFFIAEMNKTELLPTDPAVQKRVNTLLSNYQKVNAQLDSLLKINNELRIAANLPPTSADEEKLGVGGGEFNLSTDFLNSSDGVNLKKVDSYVDQLVSKVKFEKENIETISEALNSNRQLFQAIPAIKPCDGSLALHGFGMRMHPILHFFRMHNGIDIITNIGTPVHASGSGTVDFVGYRNGFGLCVEIDHGFGYRTIYGHLSKAKAKQGDKVDRNSLIAYTGNTGLSAGPHLHYEVLHNGVNLDPDLFFFDDSQIFAKK